MGLTRLLGAVSRVEGKVSVTASVVISVSNMQLFFFFYSNNNTIVDQQKSNRTILSLLNVYSVFSRDILIVHIL